MALPLALCAVSSGCDAWPTTLDNRTSSAIEYRYRHQDFDHWSASFAVAAGKATMLARAHHADEIVGLNVTEDGRTYSLSPANISRMHDVCSRSVLDRLTTLGDCWLIYHGQGRISFSRRAPPGISYDQVSERK